MLVLPLRTVTAYCDKLQSINEIYHFKYGFNMTWMRTIHVT